MTKAYKKPLTEYQQNVTVNLNTHAHELLAIVKNRYNVGNGKYPLETMSVNKVLDELRKKHSPLSYPRVSIPENLSKDIFFAGNRYSLLNSIANLIVNANSFVSQTSGLVLLEVSKVDNHLQWIVHDDGRPIPDELLETDPETGRQKIFNLGATKRDEAQGDGKGTGVGTAEVFYTARAHHGSISVYQSSDEKYFKLSFPLRYETGSIFPSRP